MANIHPSAIVAATAQLADDVTIGAWSQIGPQVCIGSGTQIGSHCVIDGNTKIGRNNRIFQFNSLGAEPQDMKYQGEDSQLIVGDNNTIREFCTFNIGTVQGGGVTKVGDNNWIMAYVHLAHDVQLGSHCVLANQVSLAGHVQVGDWAIIGGITGAHQFTRIGEHAMVGFSSAVVQDIVPFMKVDGNPLKVYGINSIGLKRRGFSDEKIALIKEAHKILYRQGLSVTQAVTTIMELADRHNSSELRTMAGFVAESKRGVAR